MTDFKHCALVCASEENADRFYQTLLGLEKAAPKTLPRSLTKAIFNIDTELTIINYVGDHLHCEIFIDNRRESSTGQIEHTCIEIENRSEFIEACRELDVSVNQVPRGEKTLLFIRDFDGNLFEIKSRKD